MEKIVVFINQNSTLAIYEQIVNQLKNQILDGSLAPGDSLPSIRALASSLEVSVITTKRAYEELEKENLICSVLGKGFYVCEANKDYLKEKQYVQLEQRCMELVESAKASHMTKEEFAIMINELWD